MARAEGLALDEVVEGLKRLPTVRAGRIGTGDIVAATPAKRRELFERYGVQACEMEGAGVAQVCHQHAVPWLVIRGITDTADYIPSDFEAVARRVTGQVAAFTTGLVADLAGRDQGGERPRGEALL
jgi:nucleoside phosphorylase